MRVGGRGEAYQLYALLAVMKPMLSEGREEPPLNALARWKGDEQEERQPGSTTVQEEGRSEEKEKRPREKDVGLGMREARTSLRRVLIVAWESQGYQHPCGVVAGKGSHATPRRTHQAPENHQLARFVASGASGVEHGRRQDGGCLAAIRGPGQRRSPRGGSAAIPPHLRAALRAAERYERGVWRNPRTGR